MDKKILELLYILVYLISIIIVGIVLPRLDSFESFYIGLIVAISFFLVSTKLHDKFLVVEEEYDIEHI